MGHVTVSGRWKEGKSKRRGKGEEGGEKRDASQAEERILMEENSDREDVALSGRKRTNEKLVKGAIEEKVEGPNGFLVKLVRRARAPFKRNEITEKL